jgi:ABC-type dipeptide/oligopeptide/nickel transport system permease subunit
MTHVIEEAANAHGKLPTVVPGDSRTVARRILPLLRRSPGASAALAMIALLIMIAILAPRIAPHDPQHSYYDALKQAPSWQFPFGTDELGRDVFSRVLYGTRISLRVGLTTTALSLGIGTVLALLATMGSRVLDTIILRAMDMLLAFPGILLALAVVAVIGTGLDQALLAVAISLIPGYVRTVRSLILGVRSREFIDAARILGGSRGYIALRHVLPNIVGGITVLATLGIALVTLEVAALSFVGLGARPPTAEWGAMLAESRSYLDSAWWMAAFPGLAITVTVLSINVVGDWLRDLLDPRSPR